MHITVDNSNSSSSPSSASSSSPSSSTSSSSFSSPSSSPHSLAQELRQCTSIDPNDETTRFSSFHSQSESFSSSPSSSAHSSLSPFFPSSSSPSASSPPSFSSRVRPRDFVPDRDRHQARLRSPLRDELSQYSIFEPHDDSPMRKQVEDSKSSSSSSSSSATMKKGGEEAEDDDALILAPPSLDAPLVLPSEDEEPLNDINYLHEMIAGSVAACITRLCIAPLDVIKIRFQIQESSSSSSSSSSTTQPQYRSIAQAVRKILREEGWRAFWKGNMAAELMVVPYGAVSFVSYQKCKQALEKLVHDSYKHSASFSSASSPSSSSSSSSPPSSAATNNNKGFQGGASSSSSSISPFHHHLVNICSGSFAGFSATFVTYPLDLMRTRFAAQQEPKLYTSLAQAFYQVAEEEGIRGLYRGMMPTLCGIVPLMAIQFACYESMKHTIERWHARSKFQAEEAAEEEAARVVEEEGKRRREEAVLNGSLTDESSSSFISTSSPTSCSASSASAPTLVNSHCSISFLEQTLCGFCAGVISKFITMPFDVIKKRFQVSGFAWDEQQQEERRRRAEEEQQRVKLQAQANTPSSASTSTISSSVTSSPPTSNVSSSVALKPSTKSTPFPMSIPITTPIGALQSSASSASAHNLPTAHHFSVQPPSSPPLKPLPSQTCASSSPAPSSAASSSSSSSVLRQEAGHRPFTGVYDCARGIVQHEGWRGLFKGTVASTLKAGPNSALIYVCYEQCMNALQALERSYKDSSSSSSSSSVNNKHH